MPFSTATGWPSPAHFALAIVAGFAATLACAWMCGLPLVESALTAARLVLDWIDDRFAIQFLGIDRDAQDTVVRLRVGLDTLFVFGSQVLEAHPQGWLEVTTTTGAMLQPMVIAPAIGFALPARLPARLAAFMLAALFAFGFLLLDLPLTLHAYVWDMFIDSLAPGRFSPLLIWHEFLHAGGRLGMGVILGLAGWAAAQQAMRSMSLSAQKQGGTS